jgi:hypothetical protein
VTREDVTLGVGIVICVVVLAVASSGCAYQVADLALATTDPALVPFELVEPGVYVRDCTMEGATGIHMAKKPPGLGTHPTVENLMAEALRRAPAGANALANLYVETSEYFVLVGRLTCVRLRGDAVRIGAGEAADSAE